MTIPDRISVAAVSGLLLFLLGLWLFPHRVDAASPYYGVVEAGAVRFTPRGDGSWWQSAFPHDFDGLDTGTLAFGAGRSFGRRFSLEGRLHFFGAAEHFAEYANDNGFHAYNGCHGAENAARCIELDGYYSSTHSTKVQAASVSSLFFLRPGKRINPYLRAGVFYARGHTDTKHLVLATVPPIGDWPGIAEGTVFKQRYTHRAADWLAGAGVQIDRFSVNYEFMHGIGGGVTNMTSAHVLTFGVRF